MTSFPNSKGRRRLGRPSPLGQISWETWTPGSMHWMQGVVPSELLKYQSRHCKSAIGKVYLYLFKSRLSNCS